MNHLRFQLLFILFLWSIMLRQGVVLTNVIALNSTQIAEDRIMSEDHKDHWGTSDIDTLSSVTCNCERRQALGHQGQLLPLAHRCIVLPQLGRHDAIHHSSVDVYHKIL